MATAKHAHSIHFDAPVEKVFHYLEDPAHFVAAAPWESHGTHATVAAVHQTPEGVVTSYEYEFGETGKHYVNTRDEYVVNERIVDRSPLGVVFTFAVEPDATATTLTFTWDGTSLMKILDAAFYHSDKKVEASMATIKREVEALP
jgi:uncharacterized protein YndB with AHSA1/START domain